METNGTRKKKKSSRFRGNGSTQHRLLQRFNYYASRRVREFYRPQERRKSANTSPGMNLTGGVRFDLFVPTRERNDVSIFPLSITAAKATWVGLGGRLGATLFEKLEYRTFPYPNRFVLSLAHRSSMCEMLRHCATRETDKFPVSLISSTNLPRADLFDLIPKSYTGRFTNRFIRHLRLHFRRIIVP